MNGKSGILLLLAVVCGLGAMFGVRKLLSKDQAVETVPVLVSARDIKAEEVLKEDMVKVTQVPKSVAPAGAASSFKDVEGRWVKIALLADEAVVEGKLAPKNAPPGLPSRIPKGMRAFTVEVNEQTGVSGFILPDHRVDVVQSKSGTNGFTTAETILEDVPVLAAGTTTTKPDDKSIQVRTVTLSLTPEQVDTVVAARAKGPLSLSLRGINDHAPAPRKPKPEAVEAAPKKPPVEKRPMLVAARDLEIGETITPEKVEVVDRPKPDIPAGALARKGDALGRKLRGAVVAGDPVLPGHLVDPGAELAEGMRSFSLEVDDQTGVAGSLRRNDHVDIIWTSQKTDSTMTATDQGVIYRLTRPDPPKFDVILQDIRVLDSPGRVRSGSEPETGAARPGGLEERATRGGVGGKWVVSLEVPADEVARLASSKATGTLTLALRPEGDHRWYVPPRPPTYQPMIGAIFRGPDQRQEFPIGARMVDPGAPESYELRRHAGFARRGPAARPHPGPGRPGPVADKVRPDDGVRAEGPLATIRHDAR